MHKSLQKVQVILVLPLKCAFPRNVAGCTITFHAYAMLTETKFVTLFLNLVFISGKMRLSNICKIFKKYLQLSKAYI